MTSPVDPNARELQDDPVAGLDQLVTAHPLPTAPATGGPAASIALPVSASKKWSRSKSTASVSSISVGDAQARVDPCDALGFGRACDLAGRVRSPSGVQTPRRFRTIPRVGREMNERLVAERLDELHVRCERRLPCRAPAVCDGQMLGADSDHDPAPLGGASAGRRCPTSGGRTSCCEPSRRSSRSGGPGDRRLVEVHRRRADERGDEQVRGALVELVRRGDLLEVPPRRTATRSPIVIASVWSCVT